MKTIKKDFTVVGAGIAGMCAAVSAARRGLKVALLNDRSVLGGNASSEIGVIIMGSSHHGFSTSIYGKEGGLVEELRQKLVYAEEFRGYDRVAAKDAVYLDFILNEPNIEMFLNTAATDVVVENNEIKSIKAYNVKSEMEFVFESPLFADCSGHGTVGFKAGASFMMGSEAKSDFGEKNAPDEYEPYTMGNTLCWDIEDTGKPVKFVAPKFAKDITKLPNFEDLENPMKFRNLSVSGGFWTLEYGGQKDTIKDDDEITQELRSLAYGIWDYIKNSGKYPKSENYIMKKMWTIPGTREGRRFYGDYVLTENDIEENRYFEDAVASGGWPMDVHDWGGFYGNRPASNFIPVNGRYNVPFRCLYSKDIKNLMLAGRNISATHIAFGSTRVMATCGCFGQAIGTAAAICMKYNAKPRDVCKSHIKELQEALIEDDQTIIGLSDLTDNCINDRFKITSSGTAKFENTKQDLIKKCDHNYVLSLVLDSKRAESVEVKLKNNTNLEQVVEYVVLTGERPETFVPEKVLKKASLSLKPDFYGYVKLDLDVEIGNDQKIYIVISKNEDISICCSNERVLGSVTWRYYDESHKIGLYFDKNSPGYNHDSTPFKGVNRDVYDSGEIKFYFDENSKEGNIGYLGCNQVDHQICFKNILPAQGIYSASNLLNEYSRPHGSLNIWKSDNLGARVVLKSDSAQHVSQLHLIFDTDLENDVFKHLPKQLVKDFDVIVKGKFGEEIISVKDNYLRLCKLEIQKEDVEEIVIDILSTYGSDYAHMYGVKIY